MRVKTIVDETFQDYKKPSMLIGTISCTWKCLKELGLDISICQNCELAKAKTINIDDLTIVNRYLSNPITSAIVFGGLEPILQLDEVISLIEKFREKTEDDIVIYTGYYHDEIMTELLKLKQYKNIVVKFGRFIPNRPSKFDDVLGIELISDNQYAIKIS
jgi:pyruvate-formate lyase-activating enzyme